MKSGQYLALKAYSASATNHLLFFSLTIERQDDTASVQQGRCPQIEYFAVLFYKLARKIITIKLESNSNLTSQIKVEPTIYMPELRCSAHNTASKSIHSAITFRHKNIKRSTYLRYEGPTNLIH